MIQLVIGNADIPLPPGYRLTRELETGLFDRAERTSDFTIPVDLPLSDEVRVALGFPDSLANPDIPATYTGTLVVDAMFVSPVTLKVLRTDLRAGTCTVSILGEYNAFPRLVGKKRVNELTLGGSRAIGSTLSTPVTIDGAWNFKFVVYPNDVHLHMADVASGAVVTDYVFGFAVDEKVTDEEYEEATTRSVFNLYSPDDGRFIDPVIYNIHASCALMFSQCNTPTRYYRTAQFRLGYVLKMCFEEHGYRVGGDIFSDPLFAQEVLHNTFSFDRVTVGEATIGGKAQFTIQQIGVDLDPRDHVPRVAITDFLRWVHLRYNLQYDFNETLKTVEVRRLKNPIIGAQVLDLTSAAFPDPTISFERENFARGYSLSFETDDEDAASGEQVADDVSSFPYRGSVGSPAGLGGISSPQAFDIAYVSAQNAFYQYGGADWFFYSHNLAPYKTSEEEDLEQVSTGAVSMPMRFDNNIARQVMVTLFGQTTRVNVPINGRFPYPFSAIGVEGRGLMWLERARFYALYNNAPAADHFLGRLQPRNTNLSRAKPHIVGWYGWDAFEGYNLPTANRYAQLSTVPVLANGSYSQGYAGCWKRPDAAGLYDDWWNIFIERLASALQVEYKVVLDAVTYNNTRWGQTVVVIDKLRYLCRKASIVMPFPDVATLTLVRVR